MKSLSSAVLALTALAVGAGPVSAQRPRGAELHARYVAAIGGKAAIEKQTSRRMWGKFEVPSQGLIGPIEMAMAAPGKLFTRAEIPGFGEQLSGYDGETAWSMNPAMGPMLIDGKALEQLKQQADFHAELHPEKYIASRETTGEAEHGGKACWVVKVTTTWQETYTECYDKATGLLAAAIRKQSTPMGEIESTTLLTEYKAFDGLLMPTLIRASSMGIEQVIRVDSVSTRPIPDSVFELPPAVKALKK